MNAPLTTEFALTKEEQAKRGDLMARKPYIAKKLARISEMEARGEISPIIRLEKSYLCNFQCTHCSAEYYMDRHLEKVLHVQDPRPPMNLEDVRQLSKEADELGLARFVITGGEPLVMKDFDAVVEAIDPERHYIITDTNGWFLDDKRARHLKEIGVEKVQLSLDSFIAEEHDKFRNKPGSYKRVMRAVDASLNAGLNLILSTVLVKGRAKTQEFRDMCEFCTERGIGLYVSYAKPTGSCTEHPEFVIDKEDADILRDMEREYKVFTHMTPSYGSLKGCITVKGIITVTSTMEVTPCPYIDFSIGNLRETPLKEVLARGMRNPWLGPYRPDCLIGEDQQFIKIHAERTKGVAFLPVPWGKGFSDQDSLLDGLSLPESPKEALFDEQGRCIPTGVTAPVEPIVRNYFHLNQPALDYAAIHARFAAAFPDAALPGADEFRQRAESILARLRDDPATRNLTQGVHVPFCLPQTANGASGETQNGYIKAVAAGFLRQFPEHRFTNHLESGVDDQLVVAKDSRYGALIEALEKGPVVGWYFPALTGYSLPAAIEQVDALPQGLLLAGGVDTAAALIAAPDLLQRPDGYPPALWLAALAEEDTALCFEGYGHDLMFHRRAHRGTASEYWTSALVALG